MTHPVLLRTQIEVAAGCGMNGNEIARTFGISKTTVHRWIKTGYHDRIYKAHLAWKALNKEKAKEAHRNWYYSNLDKARGIARDSMRNWRIQNPDKVKEKDARSYRRQYERDPEYFAQKALVRQGRMKSFPMSSIERMMCNNYYKEARRLTKETGIKHEVDHIWPLSRGGPHLPWNLRVITAEENRRKSNKI